MKKTRTRPVGEEVLAAPSLDILADTAPRSSGLPGSRPAGALEDDGSGSHAALRSSARPRSRAPRVSPRERSPGKSARWSTPSGAPAAGAPPTRSSATSGVLIARDVFAGRSADMRFPR